MSYHKQYLNGMDNEVAVCSIRRENEGKNGAGLVRCLSCRVVDVK